MMRFLICLCFALAPQYFARAQGPNQEASSPGETNASLVPGLSTLGTGALGILYSWKVSPALLNQKIRQKVEELEKLRGLLEACQMSARQEKKLRRRLSAAENALTTAKYKRLRGPHWSLQIGSGLLLAGGTLETLLVLSETPVSLEALYKDLRRSVVDVELVHRFVAQYAENRKALLAEREHELRKQEEELKNQEENQAKARKAARLEQELEALHKEKKSLESYDPSQLDLNLVPEE